jgi:hypothetical protein
MELLKSGNPNQRYDACEQLRVSRQPLSQDAINALSFAASDSNPDVADAARRALALHAPHLKLDAVLEKEREAKATTDMAAAAKTRDIMIGFLGWVLFHNIYFLICMRFMPFEFFRSNLIGSLTFVLMPFATGLVLIIITKKVWMGVGSAIAILISTIL